MSDTPRLDELRRQRALVQNHLEWLDREIAREQSSTVEPRLATVSDTTPVESSRFPPESTTGASDQDAQSIIEGYRIPTGDLHRDVRKGCLLYFFGALAALAVGIVVMYFLLRT